MVTSNFERARINTLAYTPNFKGGASAGFWIDLVNQDELAPYTIIGINIRYARGGSEPSDNPDGDYKVCVYPSYVLDDLEALVRPPRIFDVTLRTTGGAATLASAADAGNTSITVSNATGFSENSEIILDPDDTKQFQINSVANVTGLTITLGKPLRHGIAAATRVIQWNGVQLEVSAKTPALYVFVINTDSDSARQGVLVADVVGGGGFDVFG